MITCCSVFNMWPKTTLLLPVWCTDARGWTLLDSKVSVLHSRSDMGEPVHVQSQHLNILKVKEPYLHQSSERPEHISFP